MRASWLEFMPDANSEDYPSKSDVHLLPVTDLNPPDPTCIYSTLLYIESQAKKLNIVTPCITCDQPLWVKTGNYEEQHLNGEDNTQETVNNIEPAVCSEKVLNEEEIRNPTQLYELVRSGKAKDADILEPAELKKLEKNF